MLEDLDRLDRLINQMLDAGRLESGRADSDVEDVPLAPLLQDVRGRSASAIACRPRRCSWTCSPAPCAARRGRSGHHLSQPDRQRGEIRRRRAAGRGEAARTADGRAVARIADNGRGIPHQLRRKIFGRFERLGLELERRSRALAWDCIWPATLVRRLRGRIRVRDREPGRARFSRCSCPGAQAAACPHPRTPGSVGQGDSACAAGTRSRLVTAGTEAITMPATNTSWSSKTKSIWPPASSTTWWPKDIA